MQKPLILSFAVVLLWTLFAPTRAFAKTNDIDPGNQPCSSAIATAAVNYWHSHLTAKQLPYAENVQRSLCQINPANPAEMIVATGPDEQGDEDAWTVLTIIDTTTHQVVAAGNAQLAGSGPGGIAAVRIDTARYNLANGVHAFGLDAQDDYSFNCGNGFARPSFYLYVREGKRIRPVLKGLYLSESTFIQRANDRCRPSVDPATPSIIGTKKIALAVASTSSHGYRDLRIVADCSRDPALDGDHHANAPAPSRLLHYNGKEYSIGGEYALSCEDYWSVFAVVVKTTQGTSITSHASSQTFLPSTPVRILAREPARVLVHAFSGGSWWLPPEAIVELAAFKRIDAWHGPTTFEDDSADYDSGTTYRFRSDGSYTFDFEDSNGPPEHGTGHLWQYDSIIAAGSNDAPLGSYFWRQPDGSLCDAGLDGCPQP